MRLRQNSGCSRSSPREYTICGTALSLTFYGDGMDVQTKLPHLATYLGHVSPVSTHHYLQFSSELRQSRSSQFSQPRLGFFQPKQVTVLLT